MAKKVLDEKPVDAAKTEVEISKTEGQEALEAVEKNEKVSFEGHSAKKSNNTILLVVACIVVALVACVGFLGYRMLMGGNPVKITTSAIRGLKDSFKGNDEKSDEILDLIQSGKPFELKSNMKVTLPKGMGSYALNALLDVDPKGEMFKLDVDAKNGKTDIINLSAALDNSKIYFKLADTMKNYYYTDASEMINEIKDSFTDASTEINAAIDPEVLKLISSYDVNKIIDYLADAFDKTFEKSDFSKSKEEIIVNGKDVKATKYSLKVTQADAFKLLKNFVNEAKNDKELISIISKIAGIKESEVRQVIDEIANAKSEVNDKDELFTYSVYVSFLGNRLGYGFEIGDQIRVVITEKNNVTTIDASYMMYNGTLTIKKKNNNHYVMDLDLMGMIAAKLDMESDIKRVKKNQEYKSEFDLDFEVSLMGEEIKAELESNSTIKKINKIDLSDVKTGAINMDKMTDSQIEKMGKEVEKSSFYKFVENIMSSTTFNLDIDDEDEDDSTTSNAGKKAFMDEAINIAKAAETAYVSDSLNNKASECYTLSQLSNYVTLKGKYEGKVRFLTDGKGNITSKIVSLSDRNNYMILDYDVNYLTEYGVYDYSPTLWTDTYTKCK